MALQASYGVEDPEFAVTQLAQTTMRSELGEQSFTLKQRTTNLLNCMECRQLLSWGRGGGSTHTCTSTFCMCRYRRLELLSTKYSQHCIHTINVHEHIHAELPGFLFLFLDLKDQFFKVFFSDVRLPLFNVSFAGKISLDNVFQERERLNHNIVGEKVF